MQKYQCMACGWIYDPAENDDIPFEDLPDDFVCPGMWRRKRYV